MTRSVVAASLLLATHTASALPPDVRGRRLEVVADGTLIGAADGDTTGQWVAAAGDVNADGRDDFLVGAPYSDAAGTWAGAAYLVLGPSSGHRRAATAEATLLGEAVGNYTGSVSGGEDVDGDGHDDLMVGAPFDDAGGSDAGAAYLVLGPVSGEVDLSLADAKLIGEGPGDAAGRQPALAGDVDADGHGDLMVSASGEDSGGTGGGSAYLVRGPVSGTLDLESADAKLLAEAAGDYVGLVARAGDVDADGLDDVLVGSYFHGPFGGQDGAAYLLLGPVSDGTRSLGTADAELVAGRDDWVLSVASAGDMDGDGYDDVVVGSPHYDARADDVGAAFLVLGPVSGKSFLQHADATFMGERAGDSAGWSVSSAGDVDADGHDDLVIGAPFHAAGGDEAGAAYVVLGPIVGGEHSLRWTADVKLTGDVGDEAGVRVAGVGDVDADGRADVLIGAPQAVFNPTNDHVGAAFLWYGE